MAPSEHFHTREEWEAIRPIFTGLYQEQRKKLDEVRKILEHKYNFTTTVKQCKTKIREWNLGKYKKQRELLHAKRLFNEGRRRGKHVDIRLRGDPVTLDDIAKHFKRKATDLDDLDAMIPSSPTPQELTWTTRSGSSSPEVEEVDRSADSCPTNRTFTDPTHSRNQCFPFSSHDHSGTSPASPVQQALVRKAALHEGARSHPLSHQCIPRIIGIDSTERGFFNLRDLVEADFGDIRNTYPNWWNHLDSIVVDFDSAQFHHMAGRQELAVQSYDRVLAAVTRYAQLPSMALLQFVSYLLSWSAIPVSGEVVKVLFGFLQGLKNANRTHPTLAAILPCLLSSPEHASCSIAVFQECISKYLTHQLGTNSITVLRMNLRLCRHVFAMDDQEPAWSTLRAIRQLRSSCVQDTYTVIEPELDRELEMTLQLFDESIHDKSVLEANMSPCSTLFPASSPDDEADTQRHSLCNFKLGLYAIAHKQAKATLTCFRKVYADSHSHVRTARDLLARIDKIKNEIKTAGVTWPENMNAFTMVDATETCDSPIDPHPYPIARHLSTDMPSPGSFDSSAFGSPHNPLDDVDDGLYPTFTNQSDMVSVTSYPRPSWADSAGSFQSGYDLPAAYQTTSPLPMGNRFTEIE